MRRSLCLVLHRDMDGRIGYPPRVSVAKSLTNRFVKTWEMMPWSDNDRELENTRLALYLLMKLADVDRELMVMQ
jgi:hypothetical protein